ncbi:MAG: lysylphosphatidylglycerol synthase domain-containing protein [Candidatus Eisenbacteria bacterium]
MKISKKPVVIVIVTLIMVILGSIIYRNWNQIKDYDFTLDYSLLAISFGISIAGFFLLAIGWGLILKHLGAEIEMKRVISIWFHAQITRWLPGNVWSVASMFYLTRGVPKTTVALSALLALVLNMVAGVITMFGFFYWWPTRLVTGYPLFYLVPPVAFIILIFVYPNTVTKMYDNRLWRYILRKFGKEGFLKDIPPYQIERRDMSWILLYYVVYWCVAGLGFYFFVISFSHVPLSVLPGCIVIFATSWIVSFLAFVAPGGIGVKESVTTVMLAYYLPVGVAAVISLASRIWMILSELVCLLIARTVLRVKL